MQDIQNARGLYIGVVVFAIFLLAIIFLTGPSNINGVWVAPLDFCKHAGLTMFLLYIQGNAGYIVMTNNEGILLNTDVTISISRPKLIVGDMVMHITSEEGWPYNEIIPETMSLRYWKEYNKIMLYSGSGEIYGVLYKDFELSEVSEHPKSEN